MTNKYLEKVAAIIPRYVSRAVKEGVPSLVRDLRGAGARAHRASDAKWKLADSKHGIDVAKTELAINKNLGKLRGMPDSQNIFVGNSEARLHRATQEAAAKTPGLERRVRRTELAAALAQRSANGNLKRVAAGGAVSATGLTAAGVASNKE